MKNKLLLVSILLMFLFTACGQKDSSTGIAPFTEISWGSSLDQICDLEGNEYSKSLSMSGGYNYIYPKQFLNFDGYIQYNIDDNGILSGVSWFYIGNDQNMADEIYKSIHEHTNEHLGSETPLDISNVYTGDKWETEDCTVMLISFSQNDEYAVQISYLLKEDSDSEK